MNKPKVLITGASRGIGFAIFEQLLRDGFEVIGGATSLESIPDELKSCKWITADFRYPDGLKNFLSEVEKLGALDGLVNNAGINRILPLDKIKVHHYDELFEVNLKAPYFLCQMISRNMSKGGRIVNIGSIWSKISKSERTLYTAAKSGLAGLTRAMAVELGPKGILVNTVSPGFTLTELTDASLSEIEKEEISKQIPLRRMACTDEIARLVCFLIGSDNTYISGQNIIIDGGYSIV